jgi:hypothetical protein
VSDTREGERDERWPNYANGSKKLKGKQLSSDFLSAKPMSCQPSVEVGN